MNTEGYAQIWESSDPSPEAIQNDRRSYQLETEDIEFEQAYLLETDSGTAFIGYNEDEIVFAGTRTSVNDAVDQYQHQKGELIDHFNGVEEQYEPFERFAQAVKKSDKDNSSWKMIQNTLSQQEENPMPFQAVATDGGEEPETMGKLHGRFDFRGLYGPGTVR